MNSRRKRSMKKKETSKNESIREQSLDKPYIRPPTTGTSSSANDDKNTSPKSSEATSPEDQIKPVPIKNERPQAGMVYCSINDQKKGLDLKFDCTPSAFFSSKNDLPVDIASPLEGNRVPSPSSISSLTSRPLEWDSGADVGYSAHGAETGLSTIERIALAQGSAVLLPRSDPEGTSGNTHQTNLKVVCPAVKKIIGPPTAESTVIKDALFSSPLPDFRSYCPDGISPIVSSNVYKRAEAAKHADTPQHSSLESDLDSLSLENDNQNLIENVTCNMQPPKTGSINLGADKYQKISRIQNFTEEESGILKVKTKKQLDYSSYNEKQPQCEPYFAPIKHFASSEDENPTPLKRSASCSNIQLISSRADSKFLKFLKLHPHNSASSSSVSTIIDKSKRESSQNKLLMPANFIREKAGTKQKIFKSVNKISTLAKQKHFYGNNATIRGSKISSANQSNSEHLYACDKQPSPPNPKSVDKHTFENEKSSPLSVHTSIQQSILDGLQQCIQEISATFDNKIKGSSNNSERVSSTNLSDNHLSLRKSKNDVGSAQENCSTLESVTSVQTNDSWTVGLNTKESLAAAEKARSFEYLPGDLYEKNSSEHFQNQKISESTSSASDKMYFSRDFSESSKDEVLNSSTATTLFEKEMECGINLLKDFINNSTNLDVRKKQILLKKIAKKLISAERENYQKDALDEKIFQKPKCDINKTSGTFFRSSILDQNKNLKNNSSERSHSTQMSPSYLDTSSESSCLNLVKEVQKSISIESSSKNSDILPSGIQYIQENYQSNDCTFNSNSEPIDNDKLASNKIKKTHRVPSQSNRIPVSSFHEHGEDAKTFENQTAAKYSPENIFVNWSKSSSLYDTEIGRPMTLYEVNRKQTDLPKLSKNPATNLSNHKTFSNLGDKTACNPKKVVESKFSSFKNSGDFIDRRLMYLKNSSFKPFLNAPNQEIPKKSGYFDHQPPLKPDWKIPTSDSERLYEERLGKRKKEQSELLFNYLDAERKNHLLWIQSEINHLSNLKALIEKQERIKEGFKLLKSKKMSSKKKSSAYTRKTYSNTPNIDSTENLTETSRNMNSNPSRVVYEKYGLREANHLNDKSSDKENNDTSNKNCFKVNPSIKTSRTHTINHSPKVHKNRFFYNFSEDHVNQTSKTVSEEFISTETDITSDTWSENKNVQICDKCRRKIVNRNTPVSGKQKINECLCKKSKKPISYMISFDSSKLKSSSKLAKAPQLREHKILQNANLNSKISEETQLSLQECLAAKHPEIIRQVEFRRKCIADLTSLRLRQNENKRQLILAFNSENSSSEKLPKSTLSLPTIKEKRIFSQKKLRQQTEKKYRQTHEVKQKLKELKDKENHKTNRLMAATFAKKLQRKVLKGQVNLSNSVMVIDG